MKIRNLLIGLIIFIASMSSAHAMQSLWSFGSAGASAIANDFWPIVGLRVNTTATESDTTSVIAYPMTLSNLAISVITDPTPGNVTFTVSVNASPSTLTCTVTAGSTTCSDTTHTITLAVGDLVCIKVTGASSPVLSAFKGYVYKNVIQGDNHYDVWSNAGSTTSLSNSATHYLSLISPSSSSATENKETDIVPVGGSASQLYVKLPIGSPGVGKSYLFTIRKNGVDTALTCTISDANTSCQDTTNNVSFTAGDRITLSSAPTGTPTARNARVSLMFYSNISSVFVLMGNSGQTNLSGSTNYLLNQGGQQTSLTQTITNAIRLPGNLYLRSFYAYLFTAPDNGAGTQSYAYSINNSTTTTVISSTCTISEALQSCSYLYPITLSATDFNMDTKAVPASTPTVGLGAIAVTASFNAPANTNINGN